MKILLTLFLLLSTLLSADELRDAYEKEFTFLKAQKTELEKRLRQEKLFQTKEVATTKQKVQNLQNRYVKLSQEEKNLENQMQKLSVKLDDKRSNKEIIASVLIQAKSLLDEYNIEVNDKKDADILKVTRKAFVDGAHLYKQLSSLEKENGKFYLTDGTKTDGTIIKIGNIAAYGVTDKAKGALAPAGNGEYKIWNQDASADALAFAKGTPRKDIKIFIYENLDKDVEYKKEKTLEDTIKGGGTIGYIILILGALGLLLILIRTVLLIRAGSNVKEITNTVVEKLRNNKPQEALEAIKGYKGSTARVIKATLRNIDKDRDHIEDIVTENILNESSHIDRFGNFVLVLAAVAPLLGLLGTVTGMIATFDIITEFGTGDPKLLSGGISEALVTTMLGLIVAIPLLLLGNLLSGWAQNIKDSMEQAALHIVNEYEVHKEK
ncbi:flagellar motor protein MotA [Sulfurimonas sediminis]|uniref:Flagellar motor protein MotA n=1 Tax=Sulfurimonas sediminis TaxID=2590020 RepID=A0A7M1B3L8_9BACT|nr:MotA/TolQ/ExbB proton channel family protein [Sulfurimonas sediminis]QOP44106.1 flagellar motor protein MotA [Sulfurimonas sediminis]